MLRGNHPARIDDKGRLKIPNGFRTFIESQFGVELFVTSIDGERVLLYPMARWVEIERKLAALPSTSPAKVRFLEQVNFYGQVVTLDKQGRAVMPQMLRVSAGMAGDVSVLGMQDHLEVWNQKRLLERFKKQPFSEDDAKALAEHGI
jgi:MraZ protein